MSTSFPIARVKRIIKADTEIENLSSETVFLISAAAEFFLKAFAEQTLTQNKLGRKRRAITVADVKDAVRSNTRSFGFLEPIVFSQGLQHEAEPPTRKSVPKAAGPSKSVTNDSEQTEHVEETEEQDDTQIVEILE